MPKTVQPSLNVMLCEYASSSSDKALSVIGGGLTRVAEGSMWCLAGVLDASVKTLQKEPMKIRIVDSEGAEVAYMNTRPELVDSEGKDEGMGRVNFVFPMPSLTFDLPAEENAHLPASQHEQFYFVEVLLGGLQEELPFTLVRNSDFKGTAVAD